jgi:hypothetical protein
MKPWRTAAAGFAVSFLGSLPLGYLNIIGFGLYRECPADAFAFVAGVCFVEVFVVLLTLRFAEALLQRRKLLRAVDVFSVVFLVVVAIVFWLWMHKADAGTVPVPHFASPFGAGVWLSAVNLAQWPFWIGWGLYLSRENYVSAKSHAMLLFVASAMAGTFAGMTAFIVGLDGLAGRFENLTRMLALILPLAFLVMALFQARKVRRRYGFRPERKLFAIFRR